MVQEPVETFESTIEPQKIETIAPFEIPTVEPVVPNEYQTQLENQFNDFQAEPQIEEFTPVEQTYEQPEPQKERYRVN